MRRTLLLVALITGLVIAAIGPATAAITRFADVPDTNIFAKDIQWMDDNGITTGCGTDIYCPDDPVTRGQMAAFMHRLATRGVVDAELLEGMAADDFAAADHLHDAQYLAVDGTAVNSSQVDGYDANDLIRVAAWSFNTTKHTNDYSRLGSFKITAPVSGFLMLSTSLQLRSDASEEFYYCGFELDEVVVNTSATSEWVYFDTPGFYTPCAAEAVVPVAAGDYEITVLGTYHYLLDSEFSWGNASALFIPFNGSGGHPFIPHAEAAPANQMP